MKGIIRICAWISTVFYTIMSLVTFTILVLQNLNISAISTFIMFLGMAYTGWNARKYELIDFKRTKFIKAVAIFSLTFALLFVTIAPFAFSKSYGIGDSFESILVLLIMFIPAIVSSVAILIKK